MAGGRWGEPVRWGARGRDPQTQTREQMGTESQPAGTRVRGVDTGVGMGGHQGSVSSLGRRGGGMLPDRVASTPALSKVLQGAYHSVIIPFPLKLAEEGSCACI